MQPAAPGVKMRILLFATQTNLVLVGNSDGQVLKNLSLGKSSQVYILDTRRLLVMEFSYIVVMVLYLHLSTSVMLAIYT